MVVRLVSCAKCGAPLRVWNLASIVRCPHCASRLAVRRERGRQGFAEVNMSTQLLVPLGGSTEIEAENAEPRILRRRLAHLDREWETISKQYSYSVLRSQSLWGPASKSKVPRGWAAWGLGYAWVKTYVGDELI